MTDITNSQAGVSHCSSAGLSAPSPASATSHAEIAERWELAIDGMTCGRCVSAVSDALNGLPGVEVDHVRIGRASITVEPATVSPAAVIASIREAGYRASFSASSGAPTAAAAPQQMASGSCCSSR